MSGNYFFLISVFFHKLHKILLSSIIWGLSKFGIYNKKTIPSNLFVSGNFDLKNIKNTFYEVSDEKKLAQDDINFIEDEFNNFMLEDGYKKLFLFPRFKNFVKSILSESN